MAEARLDLETIERVAGMRDDQRRQLSEADALARKAAHGEGSEELASAERALQLRRQVLGEEHPYVARSMSSVAYFCLRQGDDGRAESLSRRALEIRERRLGPNHPDCAIDLDHLADLEQKRKEYAEAERLYRRAADIRKQAFGEESSAYAASLNRLGRLCFLQSNYTRAELFYRWALAIDRKALGEHEPYCAFDLECLASAYEAQGDDARAEPLYRRALGIYEQKLPDHWRRFDAQGLLGECLAKQKKFAEAEPLLISGYEGLRRCESAMLSERTSLVPEAIERLVALYEAWGQKDKADGWRRRLESAGSKATELER